MNRKAETLTPKLARHMGQALMHRLAQRPAQDAAEGDGSVHANVDANADAHADADSDVNADADALALVLVEPAATPTAPALLAARHPGGPQVQRQARAMYLRCLAHYRERIQHGRAQDDVAAAAAWFVSVNLAALQEQAVSSEQIAAIERQLRGLIAAHDGWRAASLAERQSLFEQLATLAVLVGESQVQARTQGLTAIANVRRAARGYLQQLLGLDPDALQLSNAGLAARVATQA